MAGMKVDLDHALQEKEVYRRHLKERSSNVVSPIPMPSGAVNALRQQSRGDSVSSTPSEDELPIQRHSVIGEGKAHARKSGTGALPEKAVLKAPLSERPSAPALRAAPAPAQPSSPMQSSPASLSNLDHLRTDNDEFRRNTMIQSPMTPIAPLEIHKRAGPSDSVPASKLREGADSVPSPSSFAARRSFTGARKASGSSPMIGSGSPTEEVTGISPITRKGPPAPLNLRRVPETPLPKSPGDFGPDDHTDSEYEDVEVDELPAFERGRKKTREDDDRERELIMLKEQESRSRSKKKKTKSVSKSSPPAEMAASTQPEPSSQSLSKSPVIRGFAPTSPSSARQGHLSPHASLAGVLSGPPSSSGSIVERTITISPPPVSPGLPLSPRPANRPTNAAILRSPRDGFATSPALSATNSLSPQPLSPRPPRHPIPLPPQTPSSLSPTPSIRGDVDSSRGLLRSPILQPSISPSLPEPPRLESQNALPGTSIHRATESPNSENEERAAKDIGVDTSGAYHKHSVSQLTVGGIYRGLASEAYPNLLLPPNAIPSIAVKVTSSRLKPSRHSTISPKGLDEEPVFTLGVSARSDMKQLWRVEKPIMSLPHLDQSLKQVDKFDIRLPDKSLFSGHSPAKIDARREALEAYFASMMDTAMNEKAALIICQYLSTQAISAEDQEGMKTVGVSEDQSPVTVGPDGKIIKEGYLTKRGKQFGGWKTRFFVLDDPILRYYDAPGGSSQGTVKLTNAQIGRQSAHSSHHSPVRGEDPDSQFRHAFLILEPKKKDSTSHTKHVLCAESDQERDDWVYALLQYVGMPPPDLNSRPAIPRSISASKGSAVHVSKKSQNDSAPAQDQTSGEAFNALQGTSYEDTTYAQPPSRIAPPPPPPPDTISPTKSNFYPGQPLGHANAMTISRPSNGSVIQDASAWGNKAPVSPRSREKEQKKRSIWGFRDKLTDVGASHTNGSSYSVTSFAPQHATRPVFGIPLTEAVQYCMPRGSNIPLPSVVYRCIEYLEAKGACNEEGIFRLSGSNLVIKQLKERFNTEGDLNFLADDTYYDVHAVASLLKLYLRELPSMVLTRELHVEFIQFMEHDDKAKKIAGYNVLVHKLPLPNWTLVRALSQFLIGIVNNSHINKMSVRNVGIVFAPTLNMPAPVFASFLTDFDAIFTADPPDELQVEVSAPSPLTPEDIRSPRRQLFSDIPTPSYQQDSFPARDQPQNQSYGKTNIKADSRGGFIPMQPAYETLIRAPPSRANQRQSVLIPDPEISNTFRNPQPAAGLSSTGIMRDTKARRRESSMMILEGGQGANSK